MDNFFANEGDFVFMKRKIFLRGATVILLLASIAAGTFTVSTLIASARDADLARKCAQEKQKFATLTSDCQNNRMSVMPHTPSVIPTPMPPTTTTPNSGNAEASEEARLAQQLLRQINSDRTAQGLPAFQWDTTIARAAQKHNGQMASGCGMSHQCSGEPRLGTRLTNEGVQWSSCGENVGYATAGNNAWNGILRIYNAMMGEKPPDDGHRRNLLSTSFQRIGIAVHIDGKGLVWLTEDFAR